MKISPGTSGLAQNIRSKVRKLLQASTSKIVRPVLFTTCSQNEY